jgi:hypothetical protein
LGPILKESWDRVAESSGSPQIAKNSNKFRCIQKQRVDHAIEGESAVLASQRGKQARKNFFREE